MGFITIFHHHFGNMFVIFSNHRTSKSTFTLFTDSASGWHQLSHLIMVMPQVAKQVSHSVLPDLELAVDEQEQKNGTAPFERFFL